MYIYFSKTLKYNHSNKYNYFIILLLISPHTLPMYTNYNYFHISLLEKQLPYIRYLPTVVKMLTIREIIFFFSHFLPLFLSC